MLTLLASAADYSYDTTTVAPEAAGVLAGLGAFMGFVMIVALIFGVFTIWMFIDALVRKDEDYEKVGSGSKVMWALLIFFLGFIPAIIYFFVVRKKAKNQVAAPAQTA